MKDNLKYLGLAKKAGMLAVGADDALAAVKSRKAKAIVTASDTSERTMQKAYESAISSGVKYVATEYTKFELGAVIGRGPVGVLAILDEGLAETFMGGEAK